MQNNNFLKSLVKQRVSIDMSRVHRLEGLYIIEVSKIKMLQTKTVMIDEEDGP